MKHIKTIEEMLLTEVINKQDKELNKHLHPEMYTDKESFLKYARKRKKELGKIDPSTEFQFIRYVDEEWCVHFTGRNKVSEIVKNGFKYGTSEVTSVPYGSGTKSGEKGYNYAFLASDICSADNDVTRFWGYNCVFFRCSGILGYHRGDKNRQVVFWGEDAHNIIPVVEHKNDDGSSCCAILSNKNKILYKFDLQDFDKGVEWLINNEVQYRKQLY